MHFKLILCRGCFRSGVASDLLSSALSQQPDKSGLVGNVYGGLKFQPCSVVVPGQQAGILQSLVAPAQLLLRAHSCAIGLEAQRSLLAVCLCCCVSVFHVLMSWKDRSCRLWTVVLGHYNTHWLQYSDTFTLFFVLCLKYFQYIPTAVDNLYLIQCISRENRVDNFLS